MAATADRSHFLYSRSLSAADSGRGETGTFLFDSLLYRATNGDLTNVRIFDDSGRQVSFDIRPVQESDTNEYEQVVPLRQIDFTSGADNRMTIEFERPEDAPAPDRLFLATPNTNFEKTVRVSGSGDRKRWVTLAGDRPVFDYSRFIDVRSTSVAFPARPYHYYRVVIGGVTELRSSPFSEVMRARDNSGKRADYEAFVRVQEPLRIDGVTFYRTVRAVYRSDNRRQAYRLRMVSTAVDTAQKATVVTVASNREPLRTLTLESPSVNFRRNVTVEASNDTATDSGWVGVASGEVYRIRTGAFKDECMKVPLDRRSRYLRYRLAIRDYDNTPIVISGLKAEGDVHEAVFFHKGARKLEVCYGGDDISAPRYDVAAVLSGAPQTAPQRWVLGQEAALRKATPRHEGPWKKYGKYALIAALALMVGMLGYAVAVGAKKVEGQAGGVG
jgi:hypothetical protein